MSRAVVAVDRLMTVLVGLLVLVLGAGLVLWWLDRVSWLSGSVDTSSVQDVLDQPWWPWVAGVGGVLLVVLGLRWLLAHLPARGVGELSLAGSGSQGRLLAAARPVVSAATDQLAAAPGVRSAGGKIVRERGQLVVRLRAAIEPSADLGAVAGAADQVVSDLARVLERDDLFCQVRLRLASGHREPSRVS